MTRKQFDQLVADAVASLPENYRTQLDNVAILVEDFPVGQDPPAEAEDDDLLMGEFIGVPRTSRALWDMPPEPARVVLYQKNIEAYAADAAQDDPSGPPVDEIIREEVRLTVLHELGHYFGMEEDQLEDV